MKTESNLADACWIKSSYSNAGGNCVEVAKLPRNIAVRDSKQAAAPGLLLSPRSFAAFIANVRDNH